MRKNNSGFTLMEMAMVLIIIGLLLSAVLVTRSMTRSGQIQATVSDFTKYKAAAIAFKEKYYLWPGDMNNSASFWSTATNGNGDGYICGNSTSPCTGSPSETAIAIHSLAASGLVNGSFSPTYGTVPGVNFPKSPLPVASGTTLAAPVYTLFTSSVTGSTLNTGRTILLMSDISGGTYAGSITSDNAYALDTKLDDGKALSGDIQAWDGAATCLTSSAYPLDSTASSKKCMIYQYLEK